MVSHNTGLGTPSTLGEFTKKKYTKPNITTMNLVEILTDKSDLKSVYNHQLSRLKSTFPDIPEDLTNKRMNIRYRGGKGVYHNIFLCDDKIWVVDGEKQLGIDKSGKLWGQLFINKKVMKIAFDPLEFNERINEIIENAGICETLITDLQRNKTDK